MICAYGGRDCFWGGGCVFGWRPGRGSRVLKARSVGDADGLFLACLLLACLRYSAGLVGLIKIPT